MMNQITKRIGTLNFKVVRSFCQAVVDYTDYNNQNDQMLSQNEKN